MIQTSFNTSLSPGTAKPWRANGNGPRPSFRDRQTRLFDPSKQAEIAWSQLSKQEGGGLKVSSTGLQYLTAAETASVVPKIDRSRPLGRGRNATVYRGIDRKGSEVAVKVHQSPWTKESMANLLREYQLQTIAAARVPEGVIGAFGLILTPKEAYLVQELAPRTLQEWMEEAESLSTRDLAAIYVQCVEILLKIGERGIQHNDLQLSNIAISRNDRGAWQAKLLDFGNGDLSQEREVSSKDVFSLLQQLITRFELRRFFSGRELPQQEKDGVALMKQQLRQCPTRSTEIHAWLDGFRPLMPAEQIPKNGKLYV